MGNLLAPFLFMIPTALYLDKETSHKVSSLLPAKKKSSQAILWNGHQRTLYLI
jgi:hypothetical protein